MRWDEAPTVETQQPSQKGSWMDAPEVSDGEAQYDHLINQAAQEFNLPADLLRRQIKQESGFNKDAVSPVGAEGLMQLMPGTAKDLGVTDRRDPAQSINGGARYMRQLLDRYDGDMNKALAAYNWGMGNVDKKGMDNLPEETRKYLANITAGAAGGVNAGQVDEALRVADNAIRGGVSAIPQMIVRGSEQIADFLTPEGVSIPGLRDLPTPSQAMESVSSPLAQPETEAGQRIARVGQAAVSSLAFPGSPIANAVQGAIAGTGAEVGGELGELTGGQTGRLVGSIVGGVGAPLAAGKAAGMIPTAPNKVAKVALEDLDEKILEQAVSRMKAAKEQGINLTLAQAVPEEYGGRLRAIQDVLTRQEAGAPLAKQLNAQPREVQEAAETAIANLPGQLRGPQEMANVAQREADSALKVMRQERTAAVTPLYQQTGNIPKPGYKDLRQAIKDAGQTDRAKTLTKLYNKLNPQEVVRLADGTTKKVRKPITDVQLIDDTLRELEKKMSNKPKDPRATALIQEQIGIIRDNLSGLSKGYREGSQEYARISRDVINPAKQGPLGQVAQKTGYDPSSPASRTNLYGIFDRGTSKGAKSEILTLQKDMAKAEGGNAAFVDAGKSWLSDKLQSAMTLERGQASASVASNIDKALYGTSSQAQGTRDVLAGMARAQGVPEKDLINGLENTLRTARLTSIRPGNTSGLTAKEFEDSSKNIANRLSESTLLTVLGSTSQKVARVFGAKGMERTKKQFAELMTTPEGVETLRKMAAVKPGSKEALDILRNWQATQAVED